MHQRWAALRMLLTGTHGRKPQVVCARVLTRNIVLCLGAKQSSSSVTKVICSQYYGSSFAYTWRRAVLHVDVMLASVSDIVT